jgi:hypothetical protein
VDEAALVGGVLFGAPDPSAAAEVLAGLLTSPRVDARRIRELGFEPSLVDALQQALPSDRVAIGIACSKGAAWVLGRRSAERVDSWELVATFVLGIGEIRAALAITHRLVEDVNDSLDAEVSRAAWIDIAIQDWRDEYPQQWRRKTIRASSITGYAKQNYRSLQLT